MAQEEPPSLSKPLHAPTLTELLGIEVPLIQAPIGSAACPELAAAVSNAGGLGFLGLSWHDLPRLRQAIATTQSLTPRTFGVNLVLEWPQDERLEASLESGVPVVSTFWGDPARYVRRIRASGALHLHTVGSVLEACRAVELGVDVVVAQGVEAGGHVGGNEPLRSLLAAVIEAVDPTPVVAAGGIATGAHAAELVALGAAGVWVGTRFVCSTEANAHAMYQEAIITAKGDETFHGEVFDGGWEQAPHRVLRNSTVSAWLEAGSPEPGERPGEGEIVARHPDGRAVERYAVTLPQRGTLGDVEALALYAGTGVGAVHAVAPAAEIVSEFREFLGVPVPVER